MRYQELIETISEIYNNEKIQKKGLILLYTLDEKTHRKTTEEFFYKINPPSEPCVYSDEFEVEMGGILVRFVKITEE
jgi:hypothetical protein